MSIQSHPEAARRAGSRRPQRRVWGGVAALALAAGAAAATTAPAHAATVCKPTSSTPTVKLAKTKVAMGANLKITGTGWCHPTDGGSTIAIKLDDGAYSRLDSSVNANRTVWAIVQANAKNGTFSAVLTLPNGTTTGANGSTPFYPAGSHTLRLLSGSLKTGDTIRTVLSDSFTVGAYKPKAAPSPVSSGSLTTANRGGVTAVRSASKLTLTIPGAAKGDWVYVDVLNASGTSLHPWGTTWLKASAAGKVAAPLAGVTLPASGSVTAQSGNQADYGTLRGWAPLP